MINTLKQDEKIKFLLRHENTLAKYTLHGRVFDSTDESEYAHSICSQETLQKFKVIYIAWQSSYFVIGNVFYCSIWHLLTPSLQNLEIKAGHSLSGTEPSKSNFLEKRPRNSSSSVFSIPNGSFKVKHSSSSHDSFATKGD